MTPDELMELVDEYAGWWRDCEQSYSLSYEDKHAHEKARECEAKIRAVVAPSAPSAWIACSERMPDEGEVVAVLTLCGQRFTAWPTHWRGASSGFAQWTFPSTDMDGVTVTHWMPLPETPKEAK